MKTVLLIEDNLEIRENTAELLELNGYAVFTAKNGAAGLSIAIQKRPDLILCDILMPGKSGYEVFNKLKKDRGTASIPFIFVSASVEKKEVETGIEMGAAGYIRKPFETKEFLDTVKAVFENSKVV